MKVRPVPTPFSPILSNIYLHELDKRIGEIRDEFDVGKTRPANPEYNRLALRRHRIRKKIDKAGKHPELIKEYQKLGKAMRQIPSGITSGNDYKRLRYCRYADDFVRHEALYVHDAKTSAVGRRTVSSSP